MRWVWSVLMLVALVGCGGEPESKTTSEPEPVDRSADPDPPALEPEPERVEVELLEAQVETSGKVRLVKARASITNRTSERVRYVILHVGAFDTNSRLADLNAKRNNRRLPYQRDQGLYFLVGFPEGLECGATEEATLSRRVFPDEVGLKSILINPIDYGGLEVGVQMLSSPLLPESARRRLSIVLSQQVGQAFNYLRNNGTWTRAPGVDRLPAVAMADQLGGGSLESTREESAGDKAKVVIENGTDRVIHVTIMGNGKVRTLQVRAGAQRPLEVAPGIYSFTATADEVNPDQGTREWKAGMRYDWRFWIKDPSSS